MSVAARVQIEPFAVLQEYNAWPEPVIWSDGDASHGVAAGFAHDNEMLVAVSYGPEQPDEFHHIVAITPELIGTTLRFTREWQPVALAEIKATLFARIDAAAETLRQRHVTPGAGQAIVYAQKHAEAIACLADRAATADRYPLLAATLGIDGETIVDVALRVMAAGAQWTAVAAAVEKVRLGAKAAINAATDMNSALAVAAAVSWPA